MKKFDLRRNLTYIIYMAMILVIIALSIRISVRFSEFGYYLIDDKLAENVDSLNARLEESRKNSMAAAVSMARNPDAIEAIRERDRDAIVSIFSETFDLYQVNFYTITDPEGVVVARTHEPESFGDSITNQLNIRNALAGEVSSHYESGTVVKVSVRTGAPVYDTDGTLLGVVSSGVRIDTNETVDKFKAMIGAEISVFYGDERVATTIMEDGMRVIGTRLDPEIAQTVLGGDEYSGEVDIFGAWYETYYKPIFNTNGDVFAIIFLGIPVDDLRSQSNTMLFQVILIAVICVALSAILLRALRNMDEANKAKSAFLSTMSHEIRTPMNAILGITEILLHDSSTQPTVRTALEKIHASGDLLLGIINDILDLSKIEAGKLELLPVEYETASLISDTSQLNMMRIGSKPIEFELHVDENLPIRVFGDELRVKQILNNLLSNAFKYTKEGKVTLSVSVKDVEDTDDGKTLEEFDEWTMQGDADAAGVENQATVMLVFAISDTGQGMTEAQLAKLGSEYARFNLAANRKTEGTGLGMSITKNLIHIMNGSMSVESRPGEGSTFTVELPQGKVGDEVLGTKMVENLHRFRTRSRMQMKRAQISREYMPYGSVMVVDDVETNIYVASGLLAPYGLKIDSAESGREAIEKLASGKVYDVVFMDHMMPEMDGIEATKKIREMGYTAPIVALTANAVAGKAEEFLENGFDDFISKPIDMRQMNTVLNKFVRDKQTPEIIGAARREAAHAHRGLGTVPAQEYEDPHAPTVDVSPRIIDAFLRDAAKALDVFDKVVSKSGAYNDDDFRSFTVNVHGMKTVLAIIGRQDMSDTARDLEALGREKNSAEIAVKAPPFVNALRSLVEQYTPEDEKAGSDGGADGGESGVHEVAISDEDAAYLRERLQTVKAACDNFDKKVASVALKELDAKTWPKSTRDAIHEIDTHLLHSDFDEAVKVIDGLM